MKFFKFLAVALVAMLGFSACEEDCDHDFIEVDHSKDLVGTWTCFTEDYAEALVINADGSVLSTGVEDGEYWENVKGNIKTVNNKMTLTFEDNDNFEGRFEMITGEAFTIYEENGKSFTYRYCANDLSDEIVGLWVCTQLPTGEEDMLINNFQEGGKLIVTGILSEPDYYAVNTEFNYKVFGDLHIVYGEGEHAPLVYKFNVASNATALGDIMTLTSFRPTRNGVVEETVSFLRVKQYLELKGTKYDYNKTFVTNVKALDKDVEILGTTINYSKVDGVGLDKYLKALCFAVEFPDANTIKYSYLYNRQIISLEAPIVVDGNKMTMKMSSRNAALKDVVLYTLQDQDNCQMHIYMNATGFVNFVGNYQITLMEQKGLIDTTDAAAVKAVFDSIDEAIETINVSLVMTKAKESHGAVGDIPVR